MSRLDATLEVQGVARTWHAELPDPSAAPRPLVVVLHGAGSEGARYLDRQGWAALARREEVVVVAPDALPRDPARPARFRDNPRVWNSGGPRPGEPRAQEDEAAFLAAIVADLTARGIVVDPARRYLVGHSNGAALTWKLLAEEPERWAAAVTVAGGLVKLPPFRAPARPLLAIFGDQDPMLPLAGGTAPLPWGMRREMPPILETLGRWAEREGLPHAPVERTSGPGWDRWSWGPLLTALVVHGQGHEWPGGLDSGLPPAMIGPMTRHLDATAVAWEFLHSGRTPDPRASGQPMS
ncbi:MAG TPA: PHB depolymerase family esterase [Gemmatimonadales bacterium]|nr:PHB depolymerase family esterase [Gemmatimonadales bacterium]